MRQFNKLVEVTEAEASTIYASQRPGVQPDITQLCIAGGNHIMLVSADDDGLLVDLPLCTRSFSSKWAGVEWIFSEPSFTGANPLSQYAKAQGYGKVSEFVADYGLDMW